MGQLSPKIFLVVETTEYEGDLFLSLLIRMINKVIMIGFSCIRFTAIFSYFLLLILTHKHVSHEMRNQKLELFVQLVYYSRNYEI